MKAIESMILGALAVAGAWCAEAADAVTYLEPVFGKYGETTGFVGKTVTDYTLHKDQDVGEECWYAGWHVVEGDVKVDVALHMRGDVKIILKDGATLTVNKSSHNNGGFRVEGSHKLTVYAQSTDVKTMGKIVANGGENGSAIGSHGESKKNPCNTGYITINGGVIEANGGIKGAGIGGGRWGDGRNITINGGKVTAKSAQYGAGIGGGSDAGGGYDIQINGGEVTATGGGDNGATVYEGGGAGIGGGYGAEGRRITITGGKVTASGGGWGAGIGGGYNHDGHDVTIYGGTVIATGGYYAAGIGGGAGDDGEWRCHVNGYNIYIHGGTVTAAGGTSGAGIGGGCCNFTGSLNGHADGHHIWITGGIVTATAGKSQGLGCGAGIGGGSGDNGEGYEIHITGGKVTATSTSGAGIGGNDRDFGAGYNIFISGGTVNAASENGDAIGAGKLGWAWGLTAKTHDIYFTGGSITLNRNNYAKPVNAAGKSVYKTTVTGLTETPDAITGIADFGGTDLYPDGKNKQAYLWLPEGTYSFRSGKKRYSGTVTTSGATFNPLSGGDTYGVTVDGTDVSAGSGSGWTYSSKVLTLSQAKSYTLAGANLAGLVRVKVTTNATVTIDKLQLACPNNDNAIEIAAGATDAKLTLVGDSSLAAYGAAIGVANGAKVTLAGTGAIVGGKGSYDYCRGVNVASGGTFVMDGGTIRGYGHLGDGGAINNAGTLTINGGTISDCSAKYGGALYNAGTLTINGGTISDCEVTWNGGAIYNAGSLTITGGAINDCSATRYGGAIANGSGRHTYIYGGTFKGNSADIDSPFLDSYASEVTGYLYGGVWAGKNPTEDYGMALKDGATVTQVGDLYIVGQNPKVFNGWLAEGTFTFDPLKPEYEAAGLKLMPGSVAEPQGTTPETYVLNQGAVGITVNGASITAGSGTGWTFANNVLALSSAMDYTVKGLGENPIFIDMKANAHVTLKGFGSIWDNPGRYVVRILDNASATLTLEGANLILSKANNGNAAIGILNGATLTLNGSGDLVGGKADNADGRCVWVEKGGTFVMNGGTIRGYTRSSEGAGVYSLGSVTMNGGTITDCSTTREGGGVYSAGTVTMTGGKISGNAATGSAERTGNGGGIAMRGGTLYLQGGEVSGNSATRYGGGIAVEDSTSVCTISGGKIVGNSASTGSALDIEGTVTMTGGIVKNVGGINVGSTGSFTTTGGVFDAAPASKHIASGYAATQVDDNYIVAKDLTKNMLEQLTGGTYTFDPSKLVYMAEGVMLAAGFVAEPKGGSPATYEVRMAPTGFTINGTDLCALSGNGWAYSSALQRLVLSGAGSYTLAGDGSALGFGVSVSEKFATVVLSNATVVSSMNAPLEVGAKDVTVKLVGENTLEVARPLGVPAMAVLGPASVTIDCGEGCANTNAQLKAIGGHGKRAIGGGGDVTVLGGTIVAEGGINGANVAIKGGIVTAHGASGLPGIGDAGVNVTISGGTVVAKGDGKPDIDGNVHISGGSVRADLVTSPKNAYETAVFRVTVPDVTNVTQGAAISGITGAGGAFDNYGQKDLYPLDNALSLWLTNGYYNAFYVDADKVAYFAQVSDEPTVAYRKTLDLYVNGQNIGDGEGAGWSYDWEESHLILTPGEGEEKTNRYVITGTATDGNVKAIVVEGNCDVTAADLKLGVDGGGKLSENLLQIGNGVGECTVNLTITGASAFMVANREGAAPLGVKVHATLNFRGSATIQKWDIDVADGGRVTAEDPKTLTFTSEADADAAALVVKPLADMSVFPEIDQVDYADLFVVSVVTGAVEGTWTLDYQLTDETVQTIAGSLTAAETELAANLANNDPSTTISDSIPGIYYALASAPSERALNASTPSGWYAAQGGNMEITGATYAGGTIAYYQLRATWKPLDAQEIAGTVMVPPDVGVTVDGTDVKNGEGEGWTFSGGFLTLTNSQAYVIAGTNTAGKVRVEVSAADATVTFDDLTLSGLGTTDAAVKVLSGAKLSLPGDGKLTGKNLLLVADGGTADVLGGVFDGSTPFSADDGGTLTVYGCVSSTEIKNSIASGYTCEEVLTEGGDSNFVVGKNIKVVSDRLTEGTYTFCPTNAQYEAVELSVEPGTFVTKKATTPVTWVLGVECPDYLAGYGYAVTNTFKKWAKAYPPGDPDGIYKNAFLLNVAQDREAEAVAAFKIGSIAVTNEVVGTVTNTVVVVERAQPLAPAEMFNGITWLQCATNGLGEAECLDIEDGRYTEAEKSFFIQRIDFEHTLTPEAFPEEPEGSKTTRLKVE